MYTPFNYQVPFYYMYIYVYTDAYVCYIKIVIRPDCISTFPVRYWHVTKLNIHKAIPPIPVDMLKPKCYNAKKRSHRKHIYHLCYGTYFQYVLRYVHDKWGITYNQLCIATNILCLIVMIFCGTYYQTQIHRKGEITGMHSTYFIKRTRCIYG